MRSSKTKIPPRISPNHVLYCHEKALLCEIPRHIAANCQTYLATSHNNIAPDVVLIQKGPHFLMASVEGM